MSASAAVPAIATLSGASAFFIVNNRYPLRTLVNRLNNPTKDMAKVALAGPGANFILAILFALIIWLFKITGVNPYTEINGLIVKLLYINVQINLVLGVFNLIPIPPLDGSRIVCAFLPIDIAYKYNQLERYGFFIIFFLLSFGFLNFLWVIVDAIQKVLFSGV